MIVRFVLVVAMLFGATSCAVYSHEPGKNEPHALVLFEKQEPVEGSVVIRYTTPLAVDGKKRNDWSRWEFNSVRVNPGPVTIETVAGVSNGYVAYATLEFDAVEGETYSIGGEALETEVRFYVKDSAATEVAEQLSQMELSRTRSDPIVIYM